jgi:hypothetical protein
MSPITVESGHVFATVGDTTLELDIYRAPDHDAPLVIYVHGGGWRSGDKTADTAERIAPLARYGGRGRQLSPGFPPPPLPTSSTTSRAPSVPTPSPVLHTVTDNSEARMSPHFDQRPPRTRLHRRSTACVLHVYDGQTRSRLVRFDRRGSSSATPLPLALRFVAVLLKNTCHASHHRATIPERTAHSNDRSAARFSPFRQRHS